jgi:hypothetical protein
MTPSSGSSKSICNSITSFLQQHNIGTNNLIAVGCDGTVTNTGRKGGVIRLLEEHLERPLQWQVCMLHMNELPLRHLFLHLYGKTSGPTVFTGEIGKAIVNCQQLNVCEYVPIPVSLPHYLENIELSTDQKYLWDICNAVSSGNCPKNLEMREPGSLNHARWLTCANRIIRLYLSSDPPSESLNTLAEFVCKIYAPSWFRIKINSSATDSAKNVWHIINDSRYLPSHLN